MTVGLVPVLAACVSHSCTAVGCSSQVSVDLSQVGFYVPPYMGPRSGLEVIARMPSLQVVQLLTVGFDAALPYVSDHVTLCNAVGVHDAGTAELAVALTLASLRGIDDFARAMPEGFDPAGHALGTAHCATVGGLVLVCVAEEPPDLAPMRRLVEPYLAPFDLRRARVAHSSTVVEQGNWKLVMENNRECYHCRLAHPQLCRTFPEAPLHSGGGSDEEVRATAELVERCEALGLPSRFAIAEDHQYRVMRMALLDDAQSMTLDGAPAVSRRFAHLPDGDLGDVLLYHYCLLYTSPSPRD